MSAMARRRHQARGIEPTTSASWPAAWPVEISRSHELPAERPFMDVALLRVLFAQASLAGVLLIGEAGAGPSRLPARTGSPFVLDVLGHAGLACPHRRF